LQPADRRARLQQTAPAHARQPMRLIHYFILPLI
jgi:hypothetical protein